MSSIIFEGNTYTFGATVWANPGTGNTSFVFTTLSPGSTYGFIIWAFNNFGNSSIVGPVTKVTLPTEQREEIVIYSWVYPGADIGTPYLFRDYLVENSTNLISPSQASPKGVTGPFGPVYTTGLWTIRQGFTAPDGSTTASEFADGSTNAAGSVELYFLKNGDYAPLASTTGYTFYMSFWQNTSLGKTFNNGCNFRGRRVSDSAFVSLIGKQIYPTVGATSFFPRNVYPTGSCGWIRFVFEFVGNTDYYQSSCQINNTKAGASGSTWYYWGFQAEQGDTFPQSRYDAGIADYKPNIFNSGDSYWAPIDYSVYSNSGNTLYSTDANWVASWNTNNGFTYFWPNFNTPDTGESISVADRYGKFTLKDYAQKGVTTNLWLTKMITTLKALPENRRVIRPNALEASEATIFNHYDDAITSAGFTRSGITYTYYDSQYNSISSTTGYVGSLWPVAGLSAAVNLYTKYFDAFSSTGATLAYVILDYESYPFNASYMAIFNNPDASLGYTGARTIVEDSRYRQPWNGVTALGTMMDALGATLINVDGSYYGDYNFLAWRRVVSYQNSKAYQLALAPMYSRFPNIMFGNYENWEYFGDLNLGPNNLDGFPYPGEKALGQFNSSYLYGQLSGIYNTRIQSLDSTKLVDWNARNLVYESERVGVTGFLASGGSGSYPAAGVTSPFDNYSVSLFTENASNTQHYVFPARLNGQGYSIWSFRPENTQYVYSAYLKAPSTNFNRYVTMAFLTQFGEGFSPFSRNNYFVTFDLLQGTTSNVSTTVNGCGYISPFRSHGIEHVGNSWYRCWVSDAGITYHNNYYMQNQIYSSNGPSGAISYTGSGVSGFYVWGSQFEQGTTPGLYERNGYGFTLVSQLDMGWASFIQCMGEVKAQRRSSSLPLVPWIADVSWDGQNTNTTNTRPVVGFCNAVVGYNAKRGNTFTERGGNSAYWFEMIRHTMLHGTKAISQWAGHLYEDVRFNKNKNQYIQNGDSGWYYEIKELNDTVKEVNNLIGGYTLTSGDSSRPSWLTPYLVSGSPGPQGTTWWWRVTVQPGYTLSINGYTLPDAQGNVGKWVSTTGGTLAHVPITVIS